MTKLDTIAEADATGRIDYQANKAQDAKEAAIEQVKKYASIPLNQIPRLANAIDPKTGVIYYGDASREGGDSQPKMMPLKFMSQPDQKPMVDALTLAGLKVVPHEVKQLFGTGQYAKVEPAELQRVISGPVTPAPTPNKPTDKPADPGVDPTDANMIELDKLRDRLLATLSGQGPQPSTVVDKPPVEKEKPPVEKEKTLGQKAGLGLGIAGGALAGQQLAKKAGFGGVGQTVAGVTGGALGGLGVNAFQKESIEFNSSIAQSLTESFGYDFEDKQIDEYSMSQLGKDAGDFGRGAWNGITLGTGDNIAAGVQSAFGKDTYKQALAQQTAASKEAEQRSPWLYGAGNVAGSIAVPVPGGAIAGGLIKGASTAAKVARGGVALGTNLAAQAAVDKVKQASDTKTLGYNPSKYPTTPQEIMAFQKANGLTADGKIGPQTNAVLAKLGLKPAAPATVAEDIKSIQAKLAMIESGQWRLEEDADYSVWLLEDGTVVDEQGNTITDQSMLESIEWTSAINEHVLNELSLSGIGKGLANIGKNFAGGLGQKAPSQMRKLTAAGKSVNAGFAPGAKIANKVGGAIARNPIKTAAGAAALASAGTAAAMNRPQAAAPAGTTTGPGPTSTPAATDKPTTDTPTTDTPTTDKPTTRELTPEQKEIIAKMQKIIQGVGATEDEGLLSHLAPANAAIQKATQSAASAKPATSGQAASPAGTTSAPTQTITLPKVPAGTVVNKDGVTENAEAELARWLRIARG